MKTQHGIPLWELDANELDGDARVLAQHHLQECIECRDALDATHTARSLLRDARSASPVINWAKLDGALSAQAQRVFAPRANIWWPRLGFSVALTAAALVAGWAVLQPRSSQELVLAPVPMLTAPSIASAELRSGDAVSTGPRELLLARLGDGSEVLLSGATQLSTPKAQADEVSLTLGKGRVVISASHRPRKGFVVHGDGFDVFVVGTVFSVEGKTVEVSEGAVRVVTGRGRATMVRAGQRLELAGATPVLAQTANRLPEELEEARAAVPQVARAPAPEVAATGGSRTLPRLTPAQVAQRTQPQGGVPVLVVPSLQAEVVPDPALTPTPQPVAEAASPSVENGPDEWATLPTPPKAPPTAPAAPAVAIRRQPSGDLEALFLSRAEAALNQGTCERFLLGLEDIAMDNERSERQGVARVLRARCFDVQFRPRQAMNEYRKYLEHFPVGQFAGEARRALGQ